MGRLGDVLCNARAEKGITIRKMSQELGISAMYISELENGKKIPLRGNTLPKIAVYLGLDAVEISKMAFSEKEAARTARLEDDFSLSVARKTMRVKDHELLKKIEKMIEEGE